MLQCSIRLYYVSQNKAYSGMCVHVSVWIKYGENIPIVTFKLKL